MNENKDQVKEQIKEHLKDYAEETGRPTGRKLFNCFIHDDTNASMQFKGTYYKCYGCNKTYDIFSLYALDNNLDEKADFSRIKQDLARKYGIPLNYTNNTLTEKEQRKTKKKDDNIDYTNYYKTSAKAIGDTNYLQERGLSNEVIKKYNLGYDKKKGYVVLPVSKSFYILRDTQELTEEERKAKGRLRYDIPKGAVIELFNLQNLQEADFKSVIFITESVIDALSLESVEPKIKTIALNGIANANRLTEEAIRNNFKGYFVLCLDNDDKLSGQKASRDLKEDLEKHGFRTYALNDIGKQKEDIYKGNKDINDYLKADAEALKREIGYFNDTLTKSLEAEAKKVLEQENALSYLKDFNELTLDKELNKPLSTGIERLDASLYGGLFKKNLVILGASSGIGKTTLALQIADNIASTGQDALIFSLEMSKEELIAKSLSRLMFLEDKKANHYTTAKNCLSSRAILTGAMYNANKETQELYSKAYKTYRDNIAKHIFINECNDKNEITIEEIEATIKRHIAITDAKPFIVIDYLQIIENKQKGLTDIQAVSKIVKDLKRIARKYELTILVISAFNRTSNYQEADYTSFRDTSTIEYTADVLLSFHYSVLDGRDDEDITSNAKAEAEKKKTKKLVNDAMEEDVKKLTLTILKNRNGKKKKVKFIDFYGANNFMDFRTYDYNNKEIKD